MDRLLNDALFIANHASDGLAIGDKQELDKVTWHNCDELFPKRG
jgi:hypothetical protein